ncbi:MAG: nitroreductase [Crocinitomicaceae bacterium]|jgi:nitroreductase|nr:nitroreductase [Crocinitomicaceae bacterium]
MRFNLSEITDVIRQRRTIYPEQFTSRKVQKEQVELLLNNAIWAPTHGKTQPWKFTVFQDEALQALSDFQAKTYLENTPADGQNDMKLAKLINRPLLASVVIAVHLNRDPESRISELEETEAVAAAIQNILLTATAYGLGSFWATPGVIHAPQAKDFFNLTEHDKCLGLIYLGYVKEEWPKGQRKPIEYLTEWRTQ